MSDRNILLEVKFAYHEYRVPDVEIVLKDASMQFATATVSIPSGLVNAADIGNFILDLQRAIQHVSKYIEPEPMLAKSVIRIINRALKTGEIEIPKK